MKNKEVADLLEQIADILEIQGSKFKPIAYRRAANQIERLQEPIEEIAKQGKLKDLPGVGVAIAEKTSEFLELGRSPYLEDLKDEVPAGLLDLLEIPSLGPKRVKLLHDKLKIKDLHDLEIALEKNKIRKLAGFGEKSEADIKSGLELVQQGTDRTLFGYALPIAEEIKEFLQKRKDIAAVDIAGSLRRRKETIGDIDILVSALKSEQIMKAFCERKNVQRILAKGKTKSSVLLDNNMQVDLRVVSPESYGAALQYFTGSKEHNVVMREIAKEKGFKLNEYGLFKKTNDKVVAGKTEEEIYEKLGLPIIPPEIRQNSGEFLAAKRKKLPKLIGYGSVKGDLHTHTSLTDGANTLKEMVAAAKKLGRQYIAITDHSPSERVANGLPVEKLLQHVKNIRALDKREKGIRILAGAEVNILADGQLDYDNDVLRKLDIVIASVHSRFKSAEDEMTDRITNALENKYLDILAHPTGRLIYKREPYQVDMRRVFDVATERDVYLEINASPERTDLKDVHIRQAKEHGCKFVINTDSHSTASLANIEFGIGTARRGWCEQKNVVNTATAAQLHKHFKKIDEE